MGAIRLAPRDTSFEQQAAFDPGAFDFYSTMAYDSLYHSPVSALYRGGTMAYEKNFGSENILDPEDAQQQYGLDGLLKFDEPIHESAAKLMMDRKIAEVRREQLLSNGFRHGGVGRGVTGFGVSLGASLLDPINLASMFIPIAGPTSRLTKAGMSIRKARLLTGAIEGGVGQALVEPLILFPNIYEQSNYGYDESLTNIGAGFLLGAGLHFGFGEIADKFRQVSDSLMPSDVQYISPVDGQALDTTTWRGIEEDTHKDIINTTLAQIVQDEPVTAASELIDLDRRVVMDQLRNDIMDRSRPEIQEYYLRQSREGYDLLVDQLRNKGSRLGWDPEQVRLEVERELGPDFETKVRRELTGTEPPVAYNKSIQINQIQEFELRFKKLFDSDDIESVGLDIDHPVQLLQTKTGKANFTRLYKEALKRGYNLQDAELRMGQESLVFLTKNRAIKFTSQDLSVNEIPGLTTVSEFKMKRGDMFMGVSERVVNLDKQFTEKQISKAFDEVGERIGRSFDDAQKSNVGINAKGELVLLDTGNVFLGSVSPDTPKPRTKLGKQLLRQIEANKELSPVISDADIQAEIKKRTKNLIAKKRRQYKKQKNMLDKEPPVPQARESVLLSSPIKRTPDPVEPITADTIKQDTAQLTETDVKVEDLDEVFADGLSPEEARFIQEQTAGTENINKMKKALENGINCISSKQI